MYNTIVYTLYFWYRLPWPCPKNFGQRLTPTFCLWEIYSPCFTYQPSWMLLIQLFINLTFKQHVTNKSLYLRLTLLLLLRLVRVTSLSDAAVSALLWVSMTTLTRTVGDEKRRCAMIARCRLRRDVEVGFEQTVGWCDLKKWPELISQIRKDWKLKVKVFRCIQNVFKWNDK